MPRRSRTSSFRRLAWIASLAFLVAWVSSATYHRYKPLPEGIGVATPMHNAASVRLLADFAWVDEDGERQLEQQIFDRVLGLIGQAESLVVLDMFLFNDFAGQADGEGLRPLSDEVGQALVRRKRERPDLRAVLITDPINTLYGGIESPHLDALRAAGVEVVVTRVARLRDSNPTWSGLWRICCQWAGNSTGGGWLPNPVGEGLVSLRTWMRLANFKANHRKTLVADTPSGWVGLVTSGNPHDASSAHGNIAIEFDGPAVADLLATEQAVIDFSATGIQPLPMPMPTSAAGGPTSDESGVSIQVLTEAAIREAALAEIGRAGNGDSVDLAMFYLSHRSLVAALVDAHRRGAELRILLDPNEDAFGKKKNGIPNRQVALELHRAGVDVRWCRTQGEQCHSKFLQVSAVDGSSVLIAGSANFTRRNLDNLNLETNVRVAGPADARVLGQAADYFDRRWHNRSGQEYSVPYERFADDSRFRYWQYRFMEWSGMSTF